MTDGIRWGVLSTSKIARGAVIPAIHASSNGDVIAIASRDIGKAQAAADALKIPKAYGSYDELLADEDIDAIYNPLPVGLHAEWSIRCAAAGKPVLCEKPLTANADDAQRMVAAFSSKHLLLAEALMYRYHPLTQMAKKIVDDGGVGDLRLVRASFNCSNENRGDIRYSKDLGGGGLLDVGCYCVSVLRLLTGEEPETVQGMANLCETGVDERFAGLLCFPSGVLGSFHCSMSSQFDCSYEAVGSTGHVLVDWGAMCAWPGEDFKIRYWHGDEYHDIVVPAANHYQLMVEDFAGALIEGRPVRFPIEDTLNNMATLDRLAESAGMR